MYVFKALFTFQLSQVLKAYLIMKQEIREAMLRSYVKLWVNQFQTSVGTLMM